MSLWVSCRDLIYLGYLSRDRLLERSKQVTLYYLQIWMLWVDIVQLGLESLRGVMWTLGLLVPTCAYLRSRWATCADLDYLCLPVLTLGVGGLHVHSWTTCVLPVHTWGICIYICILFCIDNLPVQTFYTSGMISLSNINPPVLKKWFHYLGMHSFLQKKM